MGMIFTKYGDDDALVLLIDHDLQISDIGVIERETLDVLERDGRLHFPEVILSFRSP